MIRWRETFFVNPRTKNNRSRAKRFGPRNLGPDRDLDKFENLGPIWTGRWIHDRNEEVSK